MDPITQQTVLAAAGAAGADPVYVDDVFSTYVYKGTGNAQTITNGIDLDGEGGLVWVKCRTAAENNILVDTERGVTNALISNSTTTTYTATNTVTAFNSNGFTVGPNGTTGSNNGFASWTFRKQKGFFDVVTYNGQSNGGTYDTWITVPHNLGSTPGMVIVKCTNAAESWLVWHRSFPTSSANLDNTSPFGANYQYFFGRPAGTVDANNIYVRAGQFASGYQGYTYVAYVFAHDDASFGTDEDESIIKCGSYTGSSANNYTQEINLGFEPQWMLVKRTDVSGGNWSMVDIMRGFEGFSGQGNSSPDSQPLIANAANDEPINGGRIKVTPTGFKLDAEGSSQWNSNNATYVYMAIRRPNKPPELATEVFAVSTQISTYPSFTSGFPVDFLINRNNISVAGNEAAIGTRLDGPYLIKTDTAASRSGYPSIGFDYMTGFAEENQTRSNNYAWMFKRAPGFMDVVKFEGTGASRSVNHNLQVVPELIIYKNVESSSYDFRVELPALVKTGGLSSSSPFGSYASWDNGVTSTTLSTTATGSVINASGNNYTVVLFATLPGISKIGTYTGNGGTQTIDCGFTNGVRFLLIRTTDWYGNWNIFDTLRGITNSSSPDTDLDNNFAQEDNNYINPHSSGFTINNTNAATINESGKAYFFLAIA